MLKNDLHKLYKWADTNNMKFNANKFNFCDMEKNRKKNPQQHTNHMMIQTPTTKNKSEI